MQYDIERARQLCHMALYGRTHTAANAIAFHSSTQHFAHGKAYARAARAGTFTIKSSHISGKMLSALPVNCLKISMFEQS